MPDRVKEYVKQIDDARDSIREDDFFKGLDAEVFVDNILNDTLASEDSLRVLAAAFVQRNQKMLDKGVSAGIKLGRAFLK